jgi:hypothetical protein
MDGGSSSMFAVFDISISKQSVSMKGGVSSLLAPMMPFPS